MNSNPLAPIWKAHQVSTECFKIAKRAIKKQQLDLFNHSDWPTQSEAKQDIIQAGQEIDNLFVLDLWATFERFAITYLQDKGSVLQNIVPVALANPIYEHFKREVEYWKPDNILDLLKEIPAIDKKLIGQAKPILRYRNWIAHGKDMNKATSISAISTAYAYQILNEIVEILLLN
ncbi:hypothetical protein BGP_4520 [Beggiatoa sp. PS]|nr:hypothetical protein BGP_4520 [Beggiatoa sp. PS]